jgi:hypothetical protein
MRWVAVCAPSVLSACATIGPPQPPSLDLPTAPSDLRASRKGDRVNLTWTVPTTTTDRQTLRELGPTSICRGIDDLKQCGTPVAKTEPQVVPKVSSTKQKTQATYVDVLPEAIQTDSPGVFAMYAVEALNKAGRGAGISNGVKIPLARTLPPPQDFQAQLTSSGIVLHWTASVEPVPVNGAHYVYRVYRSAVGTAARSLIGQVPVTDQHRYSLTDTTFEWQKTYTYRAETVTMLDQSNRPTVQVEGDDTPEVKVFADDIFPPSVPTGLQAVFSGPGQKPFIDLIWAPVTDADLAGYNVYRCEPGGAPAKLNSELVRTPAYRDAAVGPGKQYLYSVSSVDVRGNESSRSEEASESAP